MIEFATADFIPLHEFELHWRFTDAARCTISPDWLARIRPLSPARAADFGHAARDCCEERSKFDVTFRIDGQPDTVQAQLRALVPPDSTHILVSWHTDTAVACEWEIFLAHWDDFCYSSSDDVTVWPLDESWTLCYRHYDIFQFRAGKTAA